MSLASYKTVEVRVSDESRTVSGREFHSHGPETLKLLCPYLARLHRETSKSSTETVACSAVFCITITVVPDNENILCFTMLFFKLGTLISQQNNTVPLTNKGKKATTGTSLYISPDISQMANKFFKSGQ